MTWSRRISESSEESSLAALRRLPRAGLGSWPTPIERYPLSSGHEVWVKRDDRSGLGRGGAKARKIDALIAYLLGHGADELITVAGNVTNLAFDLLPILDRVQVKGSLFIVDEPAMRPVDRRAVFSGVLDRVELLGPSYSRAFARAVEAHLAARRRGGRPFLLLPGASHPAGVLGNALGFVEMVDQLEAAGEPLPDHVFVTAATGTTVAGFLLAERALRSSGRRPIHVVGVSIHRAATSLAVRGLVAWTHRFMSLRDTAGPSVIDVDRTSLDGGFGHYSPETERLCLKMMKDGCDWQLDPIFGGKTWKAMERRVQLGEAKGRVLFWHCGFTPEWSLLGAAARKKNEGAPQA